MASRVLYAPVIASYTPAFNKNDVCTVYYSLSKYNTEDQFQNVQVAIMKQGNNMSVVNPKNGDNRYRSNGKVILNVAKNKVSKDKNLYSFTLSNQDIKNGQSAGWVYKIQIRLSDVTYSELSGEKSRQDDWMNENASNFSEWSTVCVTKAIGDINIQVNQPFDYNSAAKDDDEGINSDTLNTFTDSTIRFAGRMSSPEDPSEKLYSQDLKLYRGIDDDATLIEDTGEIISNQYQNQNEFDYLFKKEFKDGLQYKTVFHYTTINGYEDYYTCKFEISYAESSAPDIKILTVESAPYEEEHHHDENVGYDSPGYDTEDGVYFVFNPNSKSSNLNSTKLTSLFQEEEEGRVGLKLSATDGTSEYYGNICIRRTDEKSNFEDQEDIKIIVVNGAYIDELPIVYDYTIESGVYYKYGVQEIDRGGNRSRTNRMSTNVMRDFQYSFLLGENDQQLKLKFDNTMQSFKIQQTESKVEPIGSTYPTITRNAATEYKVFPLAGLISFQMDENKLFCTKADVYKEAYTENHLHQSTISVNGITYENYPIYDFSQERDFRKEVLKFLQNGKPKLFKSPTEGNIIVRLMDVNCTPNQTLDRMIYSFTANANEIAEATMENYLKYNFYEVGEQAESFAKYETKIGQLSMTFNCPYQSGNTEVLGTNILKEIQHKYTGGNQQVAGFVKNIQKVYQIRITIEDQPLRVLVPGTDTYTVGNNLRIDGQNAMSGNKILIYNGFYDFDSRIEFYSPYSQGLYFLGDSDQEAGKPNGIGTVNATIDFLYDVKTEPYLGKIKESIKSHRGIGQIYQVYTPGSVILMDIMSRYRINGETRFCELSRVQGIEIEARPGCMFGIQDETSNDVEIHTVGSTGILRLYNLSDIKQLNYIGRDGVVDDAKPEDIMVTYYYNCMKGTYRANGQSN